jgi:hypothetical protein
MIVIIRMYVFFYLRCNTTSVFIKSQLNKHNNIINQFLVLLNGTLRHS